MRESRPVVLPSIVFADSWLNIKVWIHFFASVIITIAEPGYAQTASVAGSAQPLAQVEKRTLIEKVGELLTANYIYPDRAAEAKSKLVAAFAAGDYVTAVTPEALARKITSDLQEVTHDKHLNVLPPPTPRPPVGAVAAPAPQRVYAGFSRIDRLKGNIGYIKLDNFPDPAGPFSQTANQAVADLSTTDALIIDMRDNRGGNFSSVFYFCNYFFDPKKPVHIDSDVTRRSGTNEFSTKEYFTSPTSISYSDKPLYLLMSKRTSSAAERFLYDLQAQKRARLIGEVTGGSANGTAGHPLPFKFVIGIPFQRSVNPITKTNFEGVGVKPDLEVEEARAFQIAMRKIAASNPARYAGLKAELETQSTEEAFVEARLLKIRDQPQRGGEAAVRALLSGIASGKPDYASMSNELAQIIKDDFEFFHNDMKELGDAKSITFLGVNQRGLDDYEVRSATATKRFAVYLDSDGKIVAAGFYPTVPLASPH